MKRDLRKYIEEYKQEFEDSGSTKGAFYTSDFEQILNMSHEDIMKAGANGGGSLMYSIIDNALRSGFMVGYKLGKANKGV